jgi:acyl-CoA reductase-like NAD-dependent aldehyde dehydrogenase
MKIINPATEEVIRELTEDSAASVTSKFKILSRAQVAWQQQPLQKRIEVLQRFSALLETERNVIVRTLTSEVGKPIQQSINEVNGARSRIKWLTENALKYLSDEKMTVDEGLEETISYEPLGVICNISAWNYPYLVGVNVIVPALLAGNAVMYKPSEFSTLTGLEIERLLKLAGVPDDVFQTAIGGKDTGEALLNLPFDGYFFTGSYKTGHHIYNKVAGKMVPCQLELGGKDPLYVADDVADVKGVAAATADGAFYNNGQSCCAVERIYVHEKIYDRYVDEFLKEVRSWKKGAPTDEGVYIGPVTRRDQLNLLVEHVADANSKGAVIATGGHRINQKGFYFEPTVLLNVDHSMRVMREESFGPIIGIMKVKSDDEAAQLMNDTEYGLTASVYSSSEERAKKMLSKMHSGTAYWNCCDRVSAAVPWSGRKNSGIGATLSHIGLRAFTHPKAYHLRRS